MGVNKNVFASRSERLNYYKLRRTWGKDYRIYHNLPFLNVFNPCELVDMSAGWQAMGQLTLNDVDLARLKKTSIDYTVCDRQDNPILCVEFDGLQEGFNVGTSYHPRSSFDPYVTPWRQQITELKLKVAFGSMFPYFVVGSKQFGDLSPEIKLTMVDGIIGAVLAQKAAAVRLQAFDPTEAGYSQEEFGLLSSHDQHEIVQDWVIGVEVDADFEHNPITRKAWELLVNSRSRSHSSKYLTYPDADLAKSAEERGTLIDNALLEGCEVVLHTDDVGDVRAVAWLPNFKAIGFSGLGLLEELAMLLAAARVKKVREAKK